MTSKLFVFMLTPPDAEMQRVLWRSVDLTYQGSGTIAEFAAIYQEQFSDSEIAVIVSGLHVTFTNVPMSVKNKKQMLLALPFMVEEQVIGNIEDMHIAVPDRLTGDFIRIAIMDKALLGALNGHFSQCNLTIKEVFALPDLLAIHEGGLHILLSESISLVKGVEHCIQCDRENVESLVELLPRDSLSSVTISLHEQDKKSLVIAKKIKIMLSSDAVEVKSNIFSGDVHDYMLTQVGASLTAPLNLLQGSLSSSKVTGQKIREYAPVAWVAMLCWLLQIGFNFSSGYYFGHDSEKIHKNTVEEYMRIFPEEKNIVDLELQLKGKINSYNLVSKSSNFTSVFSSTVSVMMNVGNKDDIHLRQFRYDQESGELKIGFDASSISLLDKIKKNLSENDMAVEIVSANEENGVIKATLSIKHV